jgi:very-short-patch-repair endonuclease
MPRDDKGFAEREKTRATTAIPRARRDRLVSELASREQGVLDLGELGSCGLDRNAVRSRERGSRLHRMHQGVYAVGHTDITLDARFLASVKACGGGCPLSHRACAASLGIRDWEERDIEVTSPHGVDHRHAGIEVHRSSLITRGDCMVRNGIFMTNPTWTIVALALVLPKDELREATREALGLKITSTGAILSLLDRLGPVRGCRNLREIIAHALPTRSELEDVVLDAIRAGGFQIPDVNKPLVLGGRTVFPDFRWPEAHLVVEADGARWHGNALSRADDADRQALLEAHGDLVERVRWDEAVARRAALYRRFTAAGMPKALAERDLLLA